jgi:hypothetical protein
MCLQLEPDAEGRNVTEGSSCSGQDPTVPTGLLDGYVRVSFMNSAR